MKRFTSIVALALLGFSPLISYGGEEIAVNPSRLLLDGGIENVNRAFEAKAGVKVTMPDNPKGCGATVLGLKSGKLDAGIMCCPPNKEEMGDLGFVASGAAKDGIVIAVHESNSISNLSTQQVRDIFQGRITNWKQVGGKDAPIAPYAYIMCPQREEVMRQFLVGTRDYKKGVVGIDNEKLAKSVTRVKPGPEVTKRVASDSNSIGITSTAYTPDAAVKFIKLDGVAPTKQAIADDTYPLTRHLYIVTKGYPSGTTKQYIEFLRSPEGQSLIAKEGRLAQL